MASSIVIIDRCSTPCAPAAAEDPLSNKINVRQVESGTRCERAGIGRLPGKMDRA
jgi:hypothetical protein